MKKVVVEQAGRTESFHHQHRSDSPERWQIVFWFVFLNHLIDSHTGSVPQPAMTKMHHAQASSTPSSKRSSIQKSLHCNPTSAKQRTQCCTSIFRSSRRSQPDILKLQYFQSVIIITGLHACLFCLPLETVPSLMTEEFFIHLEIFQPTVCYEIFQARILGGLAISPVTRTVNKMF